MKKIVQKLLYVTNYKILMKNNILFESSPDFSDNTKAIYDKLVELDYNKKFKLIWIVTSNKFENIKIKNVVFINKNKNLISKLKYIYYRVFSKYIIDCNRYIKKINKNQLRIHLTHGEPLKIPREYCSYCGIIDYIISQSVYYNDILSELYNVKKSHIIPIGFPRNDVLFDKTKQCELFPIIDRKKTILWMPTYRNHKSYSNVNNNSFNTGVKFPFGVPCISTENELIKLNGFLKEKEILLVLKLHPAEDTSFMKNKDLSNIKLLNNDSIKQNETIYNYLVKTDALITDYSSIYFDYLLVDKPIGLAIPDIEEYKKHVELLFDDYTGNIPGQQIYTFNDLCDFINNVSNGIEIDKELRKEKTKLYHKYIDGNSSKRLEEFFSKIINGEKNEK